MSTQVLSAPLPARRRPRRRIRSRTLSPHRLGRRDLESLAAHWLRALEAGDRALRAAAGSLPDSYLAPRRRALLEERRDTTALLVGLAREHGIRQPPFPRV